mmetsp:Transcript_523/g.661  ORF Transcript_523/g.661 Transcript_523/m.661 type:complete len:152 (+) Transcript_523:177-632(+)
MSDQVSQKQLDPSLVTLFNCLIVSHKGTDQGIGLNFSNPVGSTTNKDIRPETRALAIPLTDTVPGKNPLLPRISAILPTTPRPVCSSYTSILCTSSYCLVMTFFPIQYTNWILKYPHIHNPCYITTVVKSLQRGQVRMNSTPLRANLPRTC